MDITVEIVHNRDVLSPLEIARIIGRRLGIREEYGEGTDLGPWFEVGEEDQIEFQGLRGFDELPIYAELDNFGKANGVTFQVYTRDFDADANFTTYHGVRSYERVRDEGPDLGSLPGYLRAQGLDRDPRVEEALRELDCAIRDAAQRKVLVSASYKRGREPQADELAEMMGRMRRPRDSDM